MMGIMIYILVFKKASTGIEHSHSGLGNNYHDGNMINILVFQKASIGIEHSHSGLGNNNHDGNYDLHTGIPKSQYRNRIFPFWTGK